MSSTRDENTAQGQNETLKKYTDEGKPGQVKRWLREIALVRDSKEQRRFETVGRMIEAKYKCSNELDKALTGKQSAAVLVNILWSNVKILLPVLFCRLPKPVVERMFNDSDPVGRMACTIAERCIYYQLKSQEHQIYFSVRSAVQDRLLCGRGTVKISYSCEFEDPPSETESDAEEAGESDSDETAETDSKVKKPNSEIVKIEPLNWQRYFEAFAENPFDVRWKGHEFFLTRDELIDEFGKEIGEKVELSTYKSQNKRSKKDDALFMQQASVLYIEDKASKKRIWVSEGYKDSVLREAPSLNLKDFFSYPRPLLATTTTDSNYPTADYVIYMGLAEELDRISERLSAIVDCVRLVGVCAESLAEDIGKMLRLPDGECQPIKDWMKFTKDFGGIAGVTQWFPLESALQAIPALQQRKEDIKAEIDLILGIPDIVRGASDPQETLGAQQRKTKWVSIKVTDDQNDVQRFCSEIVGPMGEMTFEPGLFEDETIQLMCGFNQMKPDDQALFAPGLQLLRDDKLSTFRVGIETDSTIALDEAEQQERWNQWMSTMSQTVGELEQITQFRPELMQPIVEGLLASMRTLRTGRSVEGALEKSLQQIQDNDAAKAQQAAQTPPPPDPNVMKAQIEQQKVQIAGQEAQNRMMEGQAKMSAMQFDQWFKQQQLQQDGQKNAADYSIKAQANQIEATKDGQLLQLDQQIMALDKYKEDFKQMIDASHLDLEKFKLAGDLKDQAHARAVTQRQQAIDSVKLAHEHTINRMQQMNDHLSNLNDHVNAVTAHAKIKQQASNPVRAK